MKATTMKEYLLPVITGVHIIDMPADAVVLSVGTRGGRPFLWTRITMHEGENIPTDKNLRVFRLASEGKFEHQTALVYLGYVEINDSHFGRVMHAFEEIE